MHFTSSHFLGVWSIRLVLHVSCFLLSGTCVRRGCDARGGANAPGATLLCAMPVVVGRNAGANLPLEIGPLKKTEHIMRHTSFYSPEFHSEHQRKEWKHSLCGRIMLHIIPCLSAITANSASKIRAMGPDPGSPATEKILPEGCKERMIF